MRPMYVMITGRLPRNTLRPAITTAVPTPTPIPAEATASAETAYLASTSGALSPPPSPQPMPTRRRYRGTRDDLPEPGTLAIQTIEERVADDIAYRVHQTSFLSGQRQRRQAASFDNGSGRGAKSLEEIATGKVVESLRYDVESGLQTLQKSPQILQEMVLDRMHYISFRGLQQFVEKNPPNGGNEEEAKEEDLIAKEAKMDLEVWIIKNELIMRQELSSIAGLLTLDDNLDIAFPDSTVTGNYREIRRRQPPKSNFCFFDERKPAAIKIHNTTAGYIETFHESTSGILDGLDWSNVVVAGGIALNTLLRVDKEKPDEEQGDTWVSADRDSDIDVYIYGIRDPLEANKKIKHIYEVWCKNVDAAALSAGAKETPEKLIIKNSKTVNFLSDYPHRRIQIILKIVASPAEVLLNFDLDPCAVGFNGKEVLMLPRCARALETGYSVFTTDLVEGHHLGDRRETQLPRVYKYADRGFGIRILPQYLRTLKQHDFRFYHPKRYYYQSPPESEFVEPAEPTSPRDEAEKHKLMKGLKLINMIAYVMDDFVHRLWIGKTKRSIYKDPYDEEESEDDEGLGSEVDQIWVDMGHFDGRRQNAGSTPHGKKGLGGFELFFWHAALWRKELEGLLVIQRDSFVSPSYEPEGYADLPKYEWDPNFKAMGYARNIDKYNSHLYHLIRDWTTSEIYIQHDYNSAFTGNNSDSILSSFEGLHDARLVLYANRNTVFADYFSRRSERLCYGSNIDEILGRELAVPVLIPRNFEEYANRVVKDVLKEKGIIELAEEDFEFLIPVHKEGSGNGAIPERARGDYNLVFWLTGPVLSWARIDRRIDEICEVLWNFFNISVGAKNSDLFSTSNRQPCSDLLKQHLDRRSPRVVSAPTPVDEPTEKKAFTWPDRREVQIFKKWMVDEPNEIDRNMAGYQGEMGHRAYKGEDYDPRIGEEDETNFWDVEDEKIDLGEWLAWRGPLQEGNIEDLEVRGEKRKRVSLAGSSEPLVKRGGVRVRHTGTIGWETAARMGVGGRVHTGTKVYL